jgi:hypothetical protein
MVIASLIDVGRRFRSGHTSCGRRGADHQSASTICPAGGKILTATASVRRAGRTIGVVDIDVTDSEGRLVAIGRDAAMGGGAERPPAAAGPRLAQGTGPRQQGLGIGMRRPARPSRSACARRCPAMHHRQPVGDAPTTARIVRDEKGCRARCCASASAAGSGSGPHRDIQCCDRAHRRPESPAGSACSTATR